MACSVALHHLGWNEPQLADRASSDSAVTVSEREIAMKQPLLLFVLLSPVTSIFAQESSYWDRFRGPNGTGFLQGAEPPASLNQSNLKWKIEVPVGYSSPVVSKDHIFLTALDEGRLVTICIDRSSGEIAWQRKTPKVAIEKLHQANHPASSTPVVDQHHVYSYFGSFGAICYDHNGNELWQKRLPQKRRGYGTSTSPIIHSELMILVLDDEENTSRILALSKHDGSTQWEISRPFLRGNGYSTPVIWNSGERKELVVLGLEQLNSYDASDGKELWWITGLSRQPIPVPVVGNQRLYVAAADRGGNGGNPSNPKLEWEGLTYFDADKDGKIEKDEMTEGFGVPLRPELHPSQPGWGFPIRNEEAKDGFMKALDLNKDGGVSEQEYLEVAEGRQRGKGRHAFMSIRPGAAGDAKDTHVAWNVRRDIAEISTPVLHDEKLFSVRDGGILTCFDAGNGDILFRARIPGASGQYCSSPIAADGKIYVASAKGVVSVLAAKSELSVLSQHNFGEEIYATPALHESDIYIRTNQKLYAFTSTE